MIPSLFELASQHRDERHGPLPGLYRLDSPHLIKLEEIPEVTRWTPIREWYVKIGSWQLGLELNQDNGRRMPTTLVVEDLDKNRTAPSSLYRV